MNKLFTIWLGYPKSSPWLK